MRIRAKKQVKDAAHFRIEGRLMLIDGLIENHGINMTEEVQTEITMRLGEIMGVMNLAQDVHATVDYNYNRSTAEMLNRLKQTAYRSKMR